ncbi:MAG TPA: alpha/beta hydrolase [Candidatus Saccharimonadales bacterium]|nr:alpha/beta hydrolase [Candidatus Saccharimonadales bacterium]
MKQVADKISRFNEKEFGGDNKKVVFLFAGMGTRIWLYKSAIQALVQNGYHVIAYDFHPAIVKKGDTDNFLQVAEAVSDKVAKHITQSKADGSEYFAAFGVSMGTLLAIKVASENPEITHLVVNLTYGSVAENVWTWKFIESTKRLAIKQGYDMESLDHKLAPVSPIPSAPKLKGKKVLLYLSSKDKILRFEQSSQFKEALDENGVDYRYVQDDKRGHIMAGLKNMRRKHIWLDFLAS